MIPVGTTIEIPLEANAPGVPGSYTFEATIPALRLTSVAQSIEVRNAIGPTSSDSPRLLEARYANSPVDSAIVATVTEPIRLEIAATNVGDARWLSRAPHGKGVVKLGWRWFKDKRELEQLAGRAPIHSDVFPGQSHRFEVVVAAPSEPGIYTLKLGLVSELVAWFDSIGTLPVTLQVEVQETPRNASPTR